MSRPSVRPSHAGTMTVICQKAGGGVSLTRCSPALSYTSLIIISIIHLRGVAFFCWMNNYHSISPLLPLEFPRQACWEREEVVGPGQDRAGPTMPSGAQRKRPPCASAQGSVPRSLRGEPRPRKLGPGGASGQLGDLVLLPAIAPTVLRKAPEDLTLVFHCFL